MAFVFCLRCGELLRDRGAPCPACGAPPAEKAAPRSVDEISDQLAAIDAQLRRLRPPGRESGMVAAPGDDDFGFACPECLHLIRPGQARCPLCLVTVGPNWLGMSDAGKQGWARDVLRRDFGEKNPTADPLAQLRDSHLALSRTQWELLVARRKV